MMPANEDRPLEIERKFLIRMPDPQRLAAESTRKIRIRQIYLKLSGDAQSRRLRLSRPEGGEEKRYYTEKIRLTDRTRIEREREIGREAWAALMDAAAPARRVLENPRLCLPSGPRTLEIDVFPFWTDRAFCEVELSAEEETFELPDWLRVIREVTDDGSYTNYALARSIPEESPDRG